MSVKEKAEEIVDKVKEKASDVNDKAKEVVGKTAANTIGVHEVKKKTGLDTKDHMKNLENSNVYEVTFRVIKEKKQD